jgi:hypothetical protein
LASAQWNDDALLLRGSELQSIAVKKKRNRTQTSVVLEKKKLPAAITEELRKPNQVILPPEVVVEAVPEYPKNIVDLWVGYRKMDQASKFSYKDFTGETLTIGVKASVIIDEWSWSLLYDTGFYYNIAKDTPLRLRDENLQIGFLKKDADAALDLYYGISYFENQIVNENQNRSFVGNKKKGLSFLLQKNQNLDESIALSYGLAVSPLVSYKETAYQGSIQSGTPESVMTSAIQVGVREKLDEHNSILVNVIYNWTQVQFKGATSVVDSVSNESIKGVKVREENFNVQIGYRWGI